VLKGEEKRGGKTNKLEATIEAVGEGEGNAKNGIGGEFNIVKLREGGPTNVFLQGGSPGK